MINPLLLFNDNKFSMNHFVSLSLIPDRITVGAVIIAEAKMIGITPAELILIGINAISPFVEVPLFWIGIFLVAPVTAMINKMIAMYRAINPTKFSNPTKIVEVDDRSTKIDHVCWNWYGIAETIPAKIISDTPLPIPFLVIWSPNHIVTIVPAIRIKIINDVLNTPEIWIIP